MSIMSIAIMTLEGVFGMYDKCVDGHIPNPIQVFGEKFKKRTG